VYVRWRRWKYIARRS